MVDKLLIENYEFLSITIGKAKIIISTAVNNLDYNLTSDISEKNMAKIKDWFKVREVGYLKQIHSDMVHVFDGAVYEGDALITDRKNTAVGVFTADCVPVLIYDQNKGIVAAVHSGWKGTLAGITCKTILKMKENFSSNAEDIYVVVGPHIRSCCYKVSQDLLNIFTETTMYKNVKINNLGKLDLAACINEQLIQQGVLQENIMDVNICTHCCTDTKMHSYRKSKDLSGRMFSFIHLDK
jgi:YfiH family protein